MKLLSVAYAVPERVVTNEDILAEFSDRIRPAVDREAHAALVAALEKSLTYVGAESRRVRGEQDRALDFGLAAARQAIAEADLAPEDIDLIIYVGVGRGFIEPATANVLQGELGCRRATCFDLIDACASWLRGMDVARQYIRCGTVRKAMIVNCEFNCLEYVDWDVRTQEDLARAWAGFSIGEAATATVLGPADGDGEFSVWFKTAGDGHNLCRIPLPNVDQFQATAPAAQQPPLLFHSDAPALTRRALELIVEQFGEHPEIGRFEYDLLLTHSASTRVSLSGIDRLDLDPERFYDVFPRFGNTVSASLPLGLGRAVEEGVLERGGRVLMVMGSAGISTGVATFTY